MTRHTSPIEVVENLNKKLERVEMLYRQFSAFAKRHKNLLDRYRNSKLRMDHFESKFLEKQEECHKLQALVVKLTSSLETESQEHARAKLCVEKLTKQFQSAREVVLALDVEDEYKFDLINSICSSGPFHTDQPFNGTTAKQLRTPLGQFEESSTGSMDSSTSMTASPESPDVAPNKEADLDREAISDQNSVASNDTTESSPADDGVAPSRGEQNPEFTNRGSYQKRFSSDEDEAVISKRVKQRSSRMGASLKVSVDENTGLTTTEALIGTKPSSTPDLLATIRMSTERRSQSFDTRSADRATDSDAPAPFKDETPTTPSSDLGLPMYRSNSASKLTNKQHRFVSKYVGPLVKCGKCKRVMKFHDALQCVECSLAVHQKCHEDAPLPCVALASITKSTKSSKESNRLLEYCPTSGPRVPPLLINCFHELEKEHRIREVGLYRNSAIHSDVQALVKKLLKSAHHDLSQYNTHVLAGVVKSFLLKLLSEPLVPTSMYSAFAKATDPERHGHSDKALRSEVEGLPQTNRDTLAYVMLHISLVGQIPDNKMDIENLTRVFAPTIVGYPLNAQMNPLLMDQNVTQRIMSRLLAIEPTFWDAIIQRAQRTMPRVPSSEYAPCSQKMPIFSSPKIS